MQNSNFCTASTNQIGGSLLSTTISSSATQNVTNTILPFATLLPTGAYLSKILSVDEGIYQEKPFLDCTHEITAPNGEVKHVKFRFFAPTETDALFQKLAEYKLVGTVAEVLVGLEENIIIAPRPNSAKYVYISQRALVTPSVSSPPHSKKSSSLGKRSCFGNKAHSTSKSPTRAILLDDDEFDDFLEENDE